MDIYPHLEELEMLSSDSEPGSNRHPVQPAIHTGPLRDRPLDAHHGSEIVRRSVLKKFSSWHPYPPILFVHMFSFAKQYFDEDS
jgi:hypothetical protein